MEPKDRVAIVTGGGTGIGAAVALELARGGARVALVGRRREPLEQIAEQIRSLPTPGEALVVPGDIASEQDMRACVDEVAARFGAIDILVNNAGILRLGRIEDMPLAVFREMIEVNYLGTVNTTKAVLPAMRQQGRGHICTVASVGAKKSFLEYGAYDASKFALAGFVDALRQELAGSGVEVSIVLPGSVDTEMGKPFLERSPIAKRVMIGADVVGKAVIGAIRHNRAQVYVPRSLQVVSFVNEVAPRGADRVIRRITLRR